MGDIDTAFIRRSVINSLKDGAARNIIVIVEEAEKYWYEVLYTLGGMEQEGLVVRCHPNGVLYCLTEKSRKELGIK